MYFDEDVKWRCFEESGSIADYLDYRGIQLTQCSAVEGECKGADEADKNT
ncbi:MAG: hypothetical protein IJ007_03470 [Oscillospiraceae bacterium]|nr:hypothetical protein [Oscillospiraceae bacterium]